MSGRPAKRRKKPVLWKYRRLRDGTVAIMRYKGKEQDVVVPAEIDGRAVTVIDGMTIVGKDEYEHEENTVTRTVTLPDTVAEIGEWAFYYMEALESVRLPKALKKISSFAFDSCSRLKKIELPDSLKIIDSFAFSGCKRLETINLPESLEVIGYAAFNQCVSLERPELPSSLRYIDSAFAECEKMADDDGFIIFGDVLYGYCGTAAEVIVPEGIRKISSGVYDGCRRIVSVKLPDTVTEIGSDAFAYCENLKSINIPKKLRQVGQRAFKGCDGLADEDGFVIVNDVLYDYIGEKTRIAVPDGVTDISANAFKREHKGYITSVELPDSVKSMSPFTFGYSHNTYSFADEKNQFFIIDGVLLCCRGRSECVTIPEGVREIGEYVFAMCNEIETVKLPNSLKKIGTGAFAMCRGLKSINLNPGVETEDTAFKGCDGLADENGFVILNGIMFDYLRKKTPSVITVPDSVNTVGKWLTKYYGMHGENSDPMAEQDEHPFWQCKTIRAKKDSVIRKYAEEKGIAFRCIRE